MKVRLEVSVDVLERLIASGALCAEEVLCSGLTDRQCLTAICKRCCAKTMTRQRPEPGRPSTR